MKDAPCKKCGGNGLDETGDDTCSACAGSGLEGGGEKIELAKHEFRHMMIDLATRMAGRTLSLGSMPLFSKEQYQEMAQSCDQIIDNIVEGIQQ